MALALGSCGIMIMSIFLPIQFAHIAPNGDPGRMAAQVISGIGFLGAGAIFKYGYDVRGLTTAASVWTMSGIGLVFGCGYYFLGATMTAMLFFILKIMDGIEDWLLDKQNVRIITVHFSTKHMDVRNITTAIKKHVLVEKFNFTENVDKNEIELTAECRMNPNKSIKEVFDEIKKAGKVKTLKLE
jgi:putative Mg2+ transporter-C (MgtC) family protein